MITVISILMILGVAYAMVREGIFNALCSLFNVLIAGLVAFHFWPPVANELEKSLTGSAAGYEDAVALLFLFIAVLGPLRLLTNHIANRDIDLPAKSSQVGGGLVGLITGYFASGFLVCVLQTLPWEEDFLGYPTVNNKGISARVIPGDQVWLKIMKRAHLSILEGDEADAQGQYFDDFSYHFSQHRRFTDTREATPWVDPKTIPPKKDPPKKRDDGSVAPPEEPKQP